MLDDKTDLKSILKDPSLLVTKALVAGEWVDADDGTTFDVTNPARGDVIAKVADLSRAQVAAVIDKAHAAQKEWASWTGKERAAVLRKWFDLMMANQEDLGILMTAEQGKPLAEAKGEIAGGVKYIRFFAEEAKRVYGDVVPSPWGDRRILVTREPVGVAGAITPWNFPNSMIARKLGAALAAGCTIVIKPSEFTPYSALIYGIMAEKAGIPAGVINILTGDAAEIGAEMCENPHLRKITFTGSTRVGKLLASNAGKHMKKISMELGGNAPFIVFDDADLDRAVAGAIACKFRNSGQTCVCANR
ncbi:aldehyde dehydrogenase family protein, partial [Thioclava electrotropha]|uniref:aldehyde dehydrogenase family protein n=1 Tax=Thioclava electrotropha TaxID=1549850 RepID=UPI0023A8EB06